MKQLILFGIVASLGFSVFGQEINKFDENGKRHGLWRKTYENSKQVRYEGTFNHGKETGVFKFYCGECGDQPTALRTFNEKDGSVWVQYFTIKGKLVSEGQMTEEIQYKNGLKEGFNYYYSPEGVLLKELEYHNNELHGPAKHYDAQGNLVIEGYYKEGKKHGVWKYFKNGVLELEETYPKPQKRG